MSTMGAGAGCPRAPQSKAAGPGLGSDLQFLCQKEISFHFLCRCYFGFFSSLQLNLILVDFPFLLFFFLIWMALLASLFSHTRTSGFWMQGVNRHGCANQGLGREVFLASDIQLLVLIQRILEIKKRKSQVPGHAPGPPTQRLWSWIPGPGVCTGPWVIAGLGPGTMCFSYPLHCLKWLRTD